MKDDAPPPKQPPRKRYQLEKVPDLWLAVWANDQELPEAERTRVQEERDRRKQATHNRVIGLLVDAEDITPEQMKELRERLSHATEIHHPWTTRRVAAMCRGFGVPVGVYQTLREVVSNSPMILAAPRGLEDFRRRTPAWEAVQYAKHRKLPITVVLPNGAILPNGRDS